MHNIIRKKGTSHKKPKLVRTEAVKTYAVSCDKGQTDEMLTKGITSRINLHKLLRRSWEFVRGRNPDVSVREACNMYKQT